MVLHYSSKQVGSAVNTVVLDVPNTDETFDYVQHNLKALQNPTELVPFRSGIHYSDIMRLLQYCVDTTKCPRPRPPLKFTITRILNSAVLHEVKRVLRGKPCDAQENYRECRDAVVSDMYTILRFRSSRIIRV